MKRKTLWVLLTITALVAPMLIAMTSHSERVRKNISLKSDHARRAGDTSARRMKEVNLTPFRRTKAELERIAKKNEASEEQEEEEGRENVQEEIWPREAPGSEESR